MTISQVVKNFIRGIRLLNIPRLEDLPYWSSPPIQFVYESTATLALGNYIWNDAPTALTPNRPLIDNALYFFRNISLTADTEEFEFTTNIITIPEFYTFLLSDSQAVLFREPILMNKFYDQFAYRLTWQSQQGSDQLFAAFRGQLLQGPGLIGKNTITLKGVISAQEIVDENFIELFRAKYPETEVVRRMTSEPSPEVEYGE